MARHINIQGVDSTVLDALENISSQQYTNADTPYSFFYISKGITYKLPLVSNGTVEKNGVLYGYNPNKKTLHFIRNGNIVHVPNEIRSKTKFSVDLTYNYKFVSGSSGSYDQCGEIYGWCNWTSKYNVEANITSEKPIANWTLRFNGKLQTWATSFISIGSKYQIVGAGTELTSNKPSSDILQKTEYLRTDYQDSGMITIYFDTYDSDNSFTAIVNFTDGTSVTKTFDMPYSSKDTHYLTNTSLNGHVDLEG